jgi:hypothetical protein
MSKQDQATLKYLEELLTRQLARVSQSDRGDEIIMSIKIIKDKYNAN